MSIMLNRLTVQPYQMVYIKLNYDINLPNPSGRTMAGLSL
jgi:hypothetical protein